MALQSAVHERQLEFVLKIRNGAQPAQQGAGPALGGVFHRQPGKGLYRHVGHILEGLAGHAYPLFMAEQGFFGRVVGHGHDEVVKNFAAAADKAQVPLVKGSKVPG